MSIFDDFGALIPEDKKEAFKTAVAAYDGSVKIGSKEDAERLFESNQHVKSVFDSRISTTIAKHDAEKLPDLVQAELKKMAPKPKDPELAAALERVEALEKAKTMAERETFRAVQLSKVLPKLTELGIDAEIADRLIGNDDSETDKLLDKFYKSVTKSRDEYATKMLRDRFGNQTPPTRGAASANTVESLKAQYADLMGKRQFQQAIMINSRIKEMEKLNG